MLRKRKVIMLGAELELPEDRAEMLVQRGKAQYAETVAPKKAKRSSPVPESADVSPPDAAKSTPATRKKPAPRSKRAQRGASVPETADVSPPENAAKPTPATRKKPAPRSKKPAPRSKKE